MIPQYYDSFIIARLPDIVTTKSKVLFRTSQYLRLLDLVPQS
jgi:hypothetical protein